MPGVDDLGLDCDDCGADVPLPFAVQLYDQSFATTIHVGSNGHATLGSFSDTFGITCSPFGVAGTTYALGPYWGDQTVFAADGHGVFTTTTGSAPNRIFYIEWRSKYFGSPDELNYEIAIHEDCNPPFEYIYNTINPASTGNDSELVIGVKKDDSTFEQFGCDPTGGEAPPVTSGEAVTATCVAGGGSPTPTPSGTPVCVPGPWQEQAPMPIDLYGAAGASDGTFFYAAGGYSFSQVPPTQAVFNRYDPVANTWTPLPDMPQSAIEALAVYYPPTNKIYVFGGEDGDSGVNYNITRIYDIASGTWTTGANMLDVRSFMAGGYVPATGMIYVVSGYSTGQVTDAQPNTWQYDPVAGRLDRPDCDRPVPAPSRWIRVWRYQRQAVRRRRSRR